MARFAVFLWGAVVGCLVQLFVDDASQRGSVVRQLRFGASTKRICL